MGMYITADDLVSPLSVPPTLVTVGSPSGLASLLGLSPVQACRLQPVEAFRYE
jgi:hypothetical protein